MNATVDLVKELQPVSCVWSAFGHRFGGSMSYDSPEHAHDSYEECITCGARFILRNLGGGRGEYRAANGEEPTECTRKCDLAAHGEYRMCEADNGRSCDAYVDNGACRHVNYECNCTLCAY